MSGIAKTPAPQVMEPLDMLGSPPLINATVFSHKACLEGQKTPKNEQKSDKIVDKISRVYDRELPPAMF